MPSTIRTPCAYAKRLTSCTARFRRSPRSPATRRPTWKPLQPAECSTKPSPLWSDLTSVRPNSPGWQTGSRSRLFSSWRSLPQTPTGQPALDTAGREHPIGPGAPPPPAVVACFGPPHLWTHRDSANLLRPHRPRHPPALAVPGNGEAVAILICHPRPVNGYLPLNGPYAG